MVEDRRLYWIIAPHYALVHSICLRKLTFTLLRATSAFLHFVQSAYAKSASSSLKLNYQPTSNRYDLVLLGKYAQFTKFDFRAKRTIKYTGQKIHSLCGSHPMQQKSPFRDLNGGGGGIRTHGTLARTTVFKTAPINRSGTPPKLFNW